MKNKPIYEHQDGRGYSVRYAKERNKRRRARELAERMMSKNYFTNTQEVMLKAVIEMNNET